MKRLKNSALAAQIPHFFRSPSHLCLIFEKRHRNVEKNNFFCDGDENHDEEEAWLDTKTSFPQNIFSFGLVGLLKKSQHHQFSGVKMSPVKTQNTFVGCSLFQCSLFPPPVKSREIF